MATVIYDGREYTVAGTPDAVAQHIAQQVQNPSDPWLIASPHDTDVLRLFVGQGVPIVVKG